MAGQTERLVQQAVSVFTCLLIALPAAAQQQDREMWEEPSHQLVFSQEDTRVLDVRVVAGVVSEYHSHRFATVYVVVQDAKIKSQRTGADWFDLSNRDRRPAGVVADRSDYLAKPYVHRVNNVDDRALHLVAIVNSRDNPRFEEHRIELGPGDVSDVLQLGNESVLVQYDGGAGHIIEGGVHHSVGNAPGAFSWHAANSKFQVANDSDAARDYVLIELKGE